MAKEKMGAYKIKGAAESKELSEDGPVIDENKKTAGPSKGKMHMDKKVDGPGRSSGYTQNFGPARVNGYAKGAAKVNSIMGKGPAQSLEDLAAFAKAEGDEVSQNVQDATDERNMMYAAGQFSDSLNLVANNQPNKAASLYGNKLKFGKVAGIPAVHSQGMLGQYGNTTLSQDGVPISMVANSQSQNEIGRKDDYDKETLKRQKIAGEDFLTAFRNQN